MTEVVVEVGPGTVRGPGDVSAELVSTALKCIDDDIALIGDHPVAVAQLWREVMSSVVEDPADTVVLVCPTWWASQRIAVICDAATTAATNVLVLQRTHVLAHRLTTRTWTVVEIAPEFVVISKAGAAIVVVPRLGAPDAVAQEVAGEVGSSAAVLVDAPVGVNGASALGVAIADRVRALGIAVSIADPDSALRGAALLRMHQRRKGTDVRDVDEHPRLNRRGQALLAGAVVSVAALCGGFAMRHDSRIPPPGDIPMTLLIEGRVGVRVPAQWTAQRITSGPGSARVHIVSPVDPETAVHITQSPLPPHQTRAMAVQALRTALDEQPDGVFVDFNPSDRRADRPAVTYREIRAGHHIRWLVLVDGTVRIGIGCQSAPGREDQVRFACDQAIESAHAVF